MKPVIKVQHVSKKYRLGVINHGTLYRDLQSWWAKVLNKPDPNSEISETTSSSNTHNRLSGDRFLALDDVSFEVKQGEVVGIIGRNGAGKSTLLKVISRITAPSSGMIHLRGRVASLLEVGTGFHPELTGRENVYLNGAIIGMRRSEIKAKFDQIVEFAELSDFIDTPVKRYSSGMYVRLAFSVAAHLEAEIMLVDEVLAVGDANFQRKCIGRMEEVGQSGRTVIFVSHNLAAVSKLCTKALLLESGKTRFFGDVQDALALYQSAAQKLNSATYRRDKSTDGLVAFVSSVMMVGRGGTSKGQFEISEEISVVIGYELSRAVRGLGLYLIVVEQLTDTNIILSCDAEKNEDLLVERKRGSYETSVKIPAFMLNVGSYRFRVRMTAGVTHYDIVDDVCFDVSDQSGLVHHLGIERKNSTLFYQLQWQTDQ